MGCIGGMCPHATRHAPTTHRQRSALVVHQRRTVAWRCRHQTSQLARASPKEKSDAPQPAPGQATAETGAALKAVWLAAEGFGKLVGLAQPSKAAAPKTSAASSAGGALSWDQCVASLRDDYSQNYFVSGKGDMLAYADDCEFADPFVSFRGKARFQQNVGNLGGLMRDIKLDVFDWSLQEDKHEVLTRWRFSCVLDLPWRPLLAAAGSTTHVIDPSTGRVVRHIEAWDVEPSKVVAQLFRPAAKVPTTAAETFFLAASDGDLKGMWWASAPLVVKLTLPVVLVSLVVKLATGEGLPGMTLGAIEGLSYLGLVAGSMTEVVKFAQGFQGGETGTGGRF